MHFKEQNYDEEKIKLVVNAFYGIRQQMDKKKDENEKKPSTSEFLDWARMLLRHPLNAIIELLKGKIPYKSILFKNKEDAKRYSDAHHQSMDNK